MELDFISWLRKKISDHPHLRLGVGDDAAILRFGHDARDCVVTSDLLSDGVHFQLDRTSAARVGRKALAVNLSDLAAMAARPHSAVVSLLLPRHEARALALELYDGILPLAEQYDVAIAGGDTNCWDGPLVISVTAVGQLTQRGALLRSGARPGDVVVVTGNFGGSILGHHYDFQPRIDEALLLHAQYDIHAAIDVSDGLALDLARVCQESKCGAVVDVHAVPVSDDAQALAEQPGGGDRATQHALTDGEDFELILAVPPGEAERMLAEQPLSVPVTRVGDFVAESGLWQTEPDGSRRPMTAQGFEHR